MERFKLLLAGCGRIARQHIKGIQSVAGDAVEIYAVADNDPARADEYKELAGAKKAYHSLSDALRNPQVQGVTLCLPHYLHHPAAIECMQAGKHVLVEKVMSTSYLLSMDMNHEAEKNNVVLMVGQSRRFFPAVEESVRIAQAGKLGQVYNISAFWQQAVKTPPTPWWSDRGKTGGLAINLLGSHLLDYITWLKEGKLPERVYATILNDNPAWVGDDNTTVVMNYADGCVVQFVLSMAQNGLACYRRLVQGRAGYMLLDDECKLTVNGETIIEEKGSSDNFGRQAMEFAAAVREKRAPRASGREVAPVNAIIDAILRSASECKEIDLPRMYPELF